MTFLIYDTNDIRVAELDAKGVATVMHDPSLGALLNLWRTDGYFLLMSAEDSDDTKMVDLGTTFYFGKDPAEFQIFWNALTEIGYSVYLD